jgi:hypothetical protein
MTDEQAMELYRQAVHNLDELIESGMKSRQEVLDELHDDLEE